MGVNCICISSSRVVSLRLKGVCFSCKHERTEFIDFMCHAVTSLAIGDLSMPQFSTVSLSLPGFTKVAVVLEYSTVLLIWSIENLSYENFPRL